MNKPVQGQKIKLPFASLALRPDARSTAMTKKQQQQTFSLLHLHPVAASTGTLYVYSYIFMFKLK